MNMSWTVGGVQSGTGLEAWPPAAAQLLCAPRAFIHLRLHCCTWKWDDSSSFCMGLFGGLMRTIPGPWAVLLS